MAIDDAPTDCSEAFRVLIAEDDQTIRSLFERVLGPLDAEIRSAEDGHEALALLEIEPADLLLVDLRMPGIDGVELTRRIRERQWVGEAPEIVAMTGDLSGLAIDAFFEAGGNRVLPKPISIGVLRETVLSARARREGVAGD